MSTFNPSKIRKAVEEFTPRRSEKFHELFAAKEVIIELRQKHTSYRSIAELLTRHCLPTCKTSVALFCHIVLGEVTRTRGRPAREQPIELEVPDRDETPNATTPIAESTTLTEPKGVENPPARARGPRIAQTYEQTTCLTSAEQEAYERVKSSQILLEQEKIPYAYAVERLRDVIHSITP